MPAAGVRKTRKLISSGISPISPALKTKHVKSLTESLETESHKDGCATLE